RTHTYMAPPVRCTTADQRSVVNPRTIFPVLDGSSPARIMLKGGWATLLSAPRASCCRAMARKVTHSDVELNRSAVITADSRRLLTLGPEFLWTDIGERLGLAFPIARHNR